MALPRPQPPAGPARAGPVGARIYHRRLEAWCEPDAVFGALYADRDHAVWLDSARGPRRGRFSFIGGPDGPLGQVDALRRRDADARRDARVGPEGAENGGHARWCRDRLARLPGRCPPTAFDFSCGFAEGKLNADSEASWRAARCAGEALGFSPGWPASLRGCAALQALGAPAARKAWLAATAGRLALRDRRRARAAPAAPAPPGTLRFELRRDPPESVPGQHRRLQNRAELIEGETYEVCLTTELRSEGSVDPLPAYHRALAGRKRASRRLSPLLQLGDVSVLSSSPERFLRVDRRGTVESRPMKGHVAELRPEPFEVLPGRCCCCSRSARWGPDDRRPGPHDLGRVSVLGSVEVRG